MWFLSRAVLCATLLVFVALGRVEAQAAEATDGDAEARRLFVEGRDAYERQLFTQAEDRFLAAYNAMPAGNPRRQLILLNVAQAIERQGGRDEDALAAWRRFEQEARDVAAEDVLLRARERIRELEERVNRRRREVPTAPPIATNGAPSTGPLAVQPVPARRKPHWSGIALASTGGAMLIAGGVVGIVGVNQRNDLLDRCDGTRCPEDARDEARQLDRLGLAGDLLIWPGLAIAATGAVLAFTLDADSSDEARPITARCWLGGCAVGGSF